jgi:hypothetical protein
VAAKKAAKKTISSPGKAPISFQPGGLHKSTGTSAGQKIPAAKVAAAAAGKLGPKAQKQALFMKNVLTGGKSKKGGK